MSQLFWILSFAVGGFSVVYMFIIRAEAAAPHRRHVRGVAEGRSDETYDAAADIVFWIVFGIMVAVLLIQITLLVSFMGRRPHVRWWQLATLGVQVILLLLSMEWVAIGDRRPVACLSSCGPGGTCAAGPPLQHPPQRHRLVRPAASTSAAGTRASSAPANPTREPALRDGVISDAISSRLRITTRQTPAAARSVSGDSARLRQCASFVVDALAHRSSSASSARPSRTYAACPCRR